MALFEKSIYPGVVQVTVVVPLVTIVLCSLIDHPLVNPTSLLPPVRWSPLGNDCLSNRTGAVFVATHPPLPTHYVAAPAMYPETIYLCPTIRAGVLLRVPVHLSRPNYATARIFIRPPVTVEGIFTEDWITVAPTSALPLPSQGTLLIWLQLGVNESSTAMQPLENRSALTHP
ncbi:hypothetical protein EV401DRAFT_2072413 [Pisolithus croceorrhizus]|nr:hypothetical protein EV401DRAFT_2072413 [Pisolithus croceorrhizus]